MNEILEKWDDFQKKEKQKQKEISKIQVSHKKANAPTKEEKSLLQMALEQLKDFLVIILMVAAIISIGLGEALEGIVILAIVILNTCLGVYQENKASNT